MSERKDPPSERDEPYRVGRGKPPLETRFQPGQSGNPSGRPRGRRLVAVDNMIAESLARLVKVKGPNGDEEVPIFKVILDQTTNLAARGDRFARQDAFRLAKQIQIIGALGDDGTEADDHIMRLVEEIENLRALLREAEAIIRDQDDEWDEE